MRGFELTAPGVVAGFVACGMAAPLLLRAFLRGLTVGDPATLLAAAGLLLATGALGHLAACTARGAHRSGHRVAGGIALRECPA